VTVELGPLLVEAADPTAVARFWTAALGVDAFHRHLVVRAQRGPKVVKNRVHLDVYVRDPQHLLALGASVLAEYLPQRVTLADVEGNEFCAFVEPAMNDDAIARVFAVCTDSGRPEEIAAWWAPLVGAEVRDGPDGTPRWLYGPAGWEQLIWKFVRVTDERVGPLRWQWSMRGATEAVTAAGAARSDDGSFVDPDGNSFSVASPGWSTGPGTSSRSGGDR
jgi:hypothetical protein